RQQPRENHHLEIVPEAPPVLDHEWIRAHVAHPLLVHFYEVMIYFAAAILLLILCLMSMSSCCYFFMFEKTESEPRVSNVLALRFRLQSLCNRNCECFAAKRSRRRRSATRSAPKKETNQNKQNAARLAGRFSSFF